MLERAVQRAGGEVHWARDALEANEIVTGVVRRTGEREVVKVKSLTTDEIRLNEALAEAGITAVETDLAERIVQLAGERPSTCSCRPCTTTATRSPRCCGRRSTRPASPRAQALAAAARAHLRAAFLRARVAISGANFAVAETGTVCVVESEGNGRMCTSLPDTLVTVMGIEKVVAEWRDLGVLMQLLPGRRPGSG